MKRFIKTLILLLGILIIASTLFFFWASSSNLSLEQSLTLKTGNLNYDNKQDSVFSIVTYNIGHLNGKYKDTSIRNQKFHASNLKNASRMLQTVNSDIIAFQDIDFNSERSLNKNQSEEFSKLGYQYNSQAVYWDKKHVLSPYWPIKKQTGQIISGLSVLSKYPIKDHERILLQNEIDLPFYKKSFYQDRIVHMVKLLIDQKEVIVLNVHLENISKTSRTIQFNYIVDLFKKYSEQYPTIILGDFNSSIKKHDGLIKQLFELPNVGYSDYKNLDYIFFNKNAIELVDSRVLNQFEIISDHLPIIMHFKLKKDF